MKAYMIQIPQVTAAELKKATKDGYLVLSRGGKAIAYVLPTSYYDEEDIGYMIDPEFWKMIQQRRAEDHPISLDQLEARISQRERAEARRAGVRRTKNGKKKAG